MVMDEILQPHIPIPFSRELPVFIPSMSVLVVIIGISGWIAWHQLAKSLILFNRVSKITSRYIYSWAYLLNGPTIIQRGFEKV